MTLQSHIQKIEEEFTEKFGSFITLGLGNVSIENENVVHHNSYKDINQFIKESISTALQDFIQQTSVEYREESGFYEADMNDGFNEAVRLMKEKQQEYFREDTVYKDGRGIGWERKWDAKREG